MRPLNKVILASMTVLILVSSAIFYGKTRRHSPRHVPQYSITDMEPAGGNNVLYQPYSINERGDVAGTINFPRRQSPTGYISHAFLWKDGKFSDLGAFGGESSEARKINAQGWIVGTITIAYKHSSYTIRTYLWHNKTLSLIPLLPSFDSNIPIAISSNGRVFGLCENTLTSTSIVQPSTPPHSPSQERYGYFQYFAGRVTVVSSAKKYHWTMINYHGVGIGEMDVPGLSSSGFHLFHAFLWKNAEAHDLGTLGGLGSYATDINSTGDVIGGADRINASPHACLWQDGKTIDLGDLGGGFSEAFAINNHNEVVGCSYPSGDSVPYHAFVWRNGEMVDLNKSIPPDSGWELRFATGINDRGQIIGWGMHNEQSHAFVLTPKAGS